MTISWIRLLLVNKDHLVAGLLKSEEAALWSTGRRVRFASTIRILINIGSDRDGR